MILLSSLGRLCLCFFLSFFFFFLRSLSSSLGPVKFHVGCVLAIPILYLAGSFCFCASYTAAALANTSLYLCLTSSILVNFLGGPSGSFIQGGVLLCDSGSGYLVYYEFYYYNCLFPGGSSFYSILG